MQGYDVFINLCDGPWDDETAGIEAISALEQFWLPFTGARSEFFLTTKEQMKMNALFWGITTPPFVFAYDDAEIEEACTDLNFPLIVKHYNGYSSINMTKDSKVMSPEQLRVQAKKLIDEFGGALIEEFIEGREFTVLAVENPKDPKNPYICTPMECRFAANVSHDNHHVHNFSCFEE